MRGRGLSQTESRGHLTERVTSPKPGEGEFCGVKVELALEGAPQKEADGAGALEVA